MKMGQYLCRDWEKALLFSAPEMTFLSDYSNCKVNSLWAEAYLNLNTARQHTVQFTRRLKVPRDQTTLTCKPLYSEHAKGRMAMEKYIPVGHISQITLAARFSCTTLLASAVSKQSLVRLYALPPAI